LGDYVVTEASLSIHYSEVIVIAVTEGYVRHDLVLTLSALNGPYDSAAGRKLIPANLPRIRKFPPISETISEQLLQRFLKARGELSSRFQLNACSLD